MKFFFVAILCVITCMPGKSDAQSFHQAKAPSPKPGSIFIFPERVPLKKGGFVTVHRGQLFAPLRRDKDSDVVAIEFYRFPRSGSALADTPPIFMLQGGPGFPGLEGTLKEKGNYERRFEKLTQISDLIVVGQRGIGSSKPDTIIELSMPSQPASKSFDEAKATEQMQAALQKERQYWLDQGVDLQGFNVLECAGDVHDIAKGLGYEKITIMGGSFGSHWGMATMRKFPDLVERAVLNGMEGPDHTWDDPGGIWNVYKRVAEDAEASDALKDLIPPGGLIKAAESLVQQAFDEPKTISLSQDASSERSVLLDGYAMQKIIRSNPGGLKGWPAHIIRLHRGEIEPSARMLFMRSLVSRKQTSTASFWMLDSGSGITAQRRAKYEADPALKVIGSTFGFYAAGSPVWETDLGDEFRQNFETQIPTLIVHGTWDTSTPYENALELAPYFKNGKLITVERGSHGAFSEAMGQSKSFVDSLSQFLVKGEMSGFPSSIELPQPNWVVPK